MLAVSLPENHYKYDDEENDAKRNIHNMLSLLITAHPSHFLITERNACHAILNDLGALGALLPRILHDASCSLPFVKTGFVAASRMEVGVG